MQSIINSVLSSCFLILLVVVRVQVPIYYPTALFYISNKKYSNITVKYSAYFNLLDFHTD